MPKDVNPDLGIVLVFLRSGQGWSQTELGEAATVSPNLLNDYERGRKPLHRHRLEYLISFMGVPPETIDATLERLEANRSAAKAPGGSAELSASRRRIEQVAARVGRLAAEGARKVLSILSLEGEAILAREEARRLWARLERRAADERLALVEESAKFRSWALCELVAAKSIEMAPSSPAKALELAELARRIAELCPGDEWLRQRAQGYAWFHVANARRVTNDLPGSDRALATARRLWEAGALGDAGIFDETWTHWIEAAVRKDQRRFSDGLRKIEEALAVDEGVLRGKLLLTKAQILGALGDAEASTEVLREAILHIDPERDPRTALGVRFQFLVCLCLQHRAAEAASEVPQLRDLAEKIDQEMDWVRLIWLEGKIAAGTGRVQEAEEAFEQVRRKFIAFDLAFNYAQVSLDLGLLLLEQGRNAEARTLADQMVWIFKNQRVPAGALAALRIFHDAARREVATVELVRRVIQFLHRLEADPKLSFQAAEEAEAL